MDFRRWERWHVAGGNHLLQQVLVPGSHAIQSTPSPSTQLLYEQNPAAVSLKKWSTGLTADSGLLSDTQSLANNAAMNDNFPTSTF